MERPYDQDDDEAMADHRPVIGHRIFDSMEDALLFLSREKWRRTQDALRAMDAKHRPDSVDGLISPDSRRPRDWCREFQALMLAHGVWGEAQNALSEKLGAFDAI